MPKYIPNKTAEIEEIQNAEIRRLTKALEKIGYISRKWRTSTGMTSVSILCEYALNPERKQ